jgi:hypothetical protein
MRSTRPRVNGVLSVIIAVILLASSVAWFALSGADHALLGPALATLVLAVLTALVAGLAFRVASRETGALALVGPLQLFTILIAVVGFVGAVLGFLFGGITGSVIAIGAGVDAFVFGLIAAIQGALVYGAAKHRA